MCVCGEPQCNCESDHLISVFLFPSGWCVDPGAVPGGSWVGQEGQLPSGG